MYITGPCAPWTPPNEKILTDVRVLEYAYTTVKFQLRSSINVPLTQNSVYNRFCIERSSKMRFGWTFWGYGQRYLVGTPYQCNDRRYTRFQTSLVQI